MMKDKHGFKAVKLLDFESQWEMLEKSTNPFALMVMIHLRTISTQGKPQSRMEWKLQLAKGLYDRGLPEKDIVEMFRFMGWMMALTPRMEKRFERDLKMYEEERKMPALSPFERRVIGKERLEGKAAVLFGGLALSISSAFAGNPPPPARSPAQPSYLTDWILVAVVVLVIFAILHRLHKSRTGRP